MDIGDDIYECLIFPGFPIFVGVVVKSEASCFGCPTGAYQPQVLKRTKLLDAGVSVAMPMLSPELDLTAAGTWQREGDSMQRFCVFKWQIESVRF